jgi:hypothetical protein
MKIKPQAIEAVHLKSRYTSASLHEKSIQPI